MNRIGKWGGLGFGICLGSMWTAQGMDFSHGARLAVLPGLLVGIVTIVGLMLSNQRRPADV